MSLDGEATGLRYVPMDFPLGTRISMVGGGGKSTLARALSVSTGLPFIELDAIHWLPNWGERTDEEMRVETERAMAGAPTGWIIDGHYWSQIGDLVLRQADIVLWVDMPWRVLLWRTIKRSAQRAWDKQQICGENTESWGQFFSTRSLWWFHLRNRARYNSREARLAELLPSDTPVIRLTTPAELNRFYETQGLARP